MMIDVWKVRFMRYETVCWSDDLDCTIMELEACSWRVVCFRIMLFSSSSSISDCFRTVVGEGGKILTPPASSKQKRL